MSVLDDIDNLTVAQLRGEPMIARAMDLLIREAERVREENIPLLDATAKLSEVTSWVQRRYALVADAEGLNCAYLAALYRLFVLFGGDASDLWVWHECEDVLAEVRASLRPPSALRGGDGGAA